MAAVKAASRTAEDLAVEIEAAAYELLDTLGDDPTCVKHYRKQIIALANEIAFASVGMNG